MEKDKICFVIGKNLSGKNIREKLRYVLDDMLLDEISTFFFAFDNVFSQLCLSVLREFQQKGAEIKILSNYPHNCSLFFCQNSKMSKLPSLDGLCLREVQMCINKYMLEKSDVVLFSVPKGKTSLQMKQLDMMTSVLNKRKIIL